MTDHFEKANILDQHCKSVVTTEDYFTIPCLPHAVSGQGAYNILSNLLKSPGSDFIHPFILKAIATEISSLYMLAHIFSQSLETGCVPSDWKHAYVTPSLYWYGL